MATKLKPSAFATYKSDNIKPIVRCDSWGAGQLTLEGDIAFISYLNEKARGIDAIKFER